MLTTEGLTFLTRGEKEPGAAGRSEVVCAGVSTIQHDNESNMRPVIVRKKARPLRVDVKMFCFLFCMVFSFVIKCYDKKLIS